MAELKGAAAYPLAWPKGWTRAKIRVSSSFTSNGEKAFKFLQAELNRLGAKNIVISTDVPLAITTGRPKMDREPVDSGVAVYFTRNDKQLVFACDKFDRLWENAQALAKTIEAIRGIERWGTSDLMERSFSGFKMLNASSERPWWEVLKIDRALATRHLVDTAYRNLLRRCHPDIGGSHESMSELNVAKQQALEELS